MKHRAAAARKCTKRSRRAHMLRMTEARILKMNEARILKKEMARRELLLPPPFAAVDAITGISNGSQFCETMQEKNTTFSNSVSQQRLPTTSAEVNANSSNSIVSPFCETTQEKDTTFSASHSQRLPTTICELDCLSPLFENVSCKKCKKPGLVLKEGNGSKSYSVQLHLWCPTCEANISETYTSRGQPSERNDRLTAL